MYIRYEKQINPFMELDLIFSIANTFAFVMWMLLILAPKWKHTSCLVIPGAIALLCIVYVFLISSTISSFDPSSFSTLDNVKALFQDDKAVLAGWVHYLAFDLFVGAYIVDQGKSIPLPRWQYTLCLPFTFMFGPAGLLLFYILRQLHAGRRKPD